MIGEDAFIGCSSCRAIRRTSPSPYSLPFLHILGFVTWASDKEVHFGCCWYSAVSLCPLLLPTSFPESIVSLSRLPSSEPEATMARSMSPVARWQTQYVSASFGACRKGQTEGESAAR